MSDGALRISILGDASQLKETLADLQDRLEKFKEQLKTATGAAVPDLNFKINGIETTIKQITEFGKFAEGSLGFYKQLKRELEDQLNVTTNRAEQEQLVKRLSDVSNIIKDIKSAGIEKPIPVPIVIEPPPPGSIADIKRQISETVKEKEIAIGVNLTNANIKLRDLRNQLNAAETQGIEIEAKPITPVLENSIQGIKNRIDELNRKKVLIDIDNEGEIAQINQELDGLTTKLAKANSLSFDKDGKISANAGKAGRALTSLSLIAQDLPFGFIAIQNNLPALSETFGQLKNQAGGIKGAFKELGTALVGPAGFFLAFSAVTAAVTFAIKEYGSLGAAVDAFLGIQSSLTAELKKASETLQEYNEGLITNDELIRKQTASAKSNVTKIKALGSIVTDTSKSLDERKAALKDLQKIDDDYFGALNIEKLNYSQLKNAIDTYNQSLGQSAITKGFQDRLSKANKELEDQEILLEKLRKRIDEVKAAPIKITSAGTIDKTAIDNATSAYNAQKVVVDALRKDQLNYEEQLQRSINTETGLKAPILSAAEAYRKKQEELKKSTKATKNVTKATKEYKEELSKVVPLFDMFQIKEKKTKQGLFFDFLEGLFSKNDLSQLKEAYKRIQDAQKEIDKFREAEPKLPDVDPIKRLQGKIDESEAFRKGLAEDFEGIKQTLQDVFFTPVSDLFDNFFETGKFAFDEFGKSILKTIKSLVSRIIATGIINLLANILFPGGGTASSALGGSATGAGGGILGAFGAAFKSVLGIGKIANPNFGGVQGGGMQLAGEVVFRQRGSDLIGVINRTNGTINRVG